MPSTMTRKPAAAAPPQALAFRTLESFPAYAAALGRVRDLERQHDDLLRAIEAAGRPGDRESWLQRQAERMLRGESPDGPDPESERRQSLEGLRPRLPVVEMALQMARGRLETERRAASKTICEETAPTFKALARRAAEATCELWRLSQVHEEFWSGLDSAGVVRVAPLAFAAPSWPGDLRQSSDRGSHYLRELIDAGLVSADEEFLRGTCLHVPRE